MAGEAIAAGVGIFILLFFVLWIVIAVGSLLLMIFWILMIVDVAKRDFKNENDKILWILIVILASWIGALVYYFVIKKPDKH